MFSELNYVIQSFHNWEKALLFSFISYCLILFAIIFVLTFILKDFIFSLVLGISSAYIFSLVVIMVISIKMFKRNLL